MDLFAKKKALGYDSKASKKKTPNANCSLRAEPNNGISNAIDNLNEFNVFLMNEKN